MTTYHGKATTFFLGSNDLSAYITDASINFGQDIAEVTAKGDTAKRHKVGHYGAEISLSGRWDDTASTGPDALLFGLLADASGETFRLGMGGNGAGRVYTGVVLLSVYTPSSPLAGVVDFSATLVVDAAVAIDADGP